MGLLDSVLGALVGGQTGAQVGGGAQGALLTAVVGLLVNSGQGAGGANGGLGELVTKFTQSGMGDVIGSWVGHGQNAPISGDQLSDVLGTDAIGSIASQLGLSHGDAAGQLAQMLPQVIDKLTPHGEVPEGGLGGLGDILAQLSKR